MRGHNAAARVASFVQPLCVSAGFKVGDDTNCVVNVRSLFVPRLNRSVVIATPQAAVAGSTPGVALVRERASSQAVFQCGLELNVPEIASFLFVSIGGGANKGCCRKSAHLWNDHVYGKGCFRSYV